MLRSSPWRKAFPKSSRPFHTVRLGGSKSASKRAFQSSSSIFHSEIFARWRAVISLKLLRNRKTVGARLLWRKSEFQLLRCQSMKSQKLPLSSLLSQWMLHKNLFNSSKTAMNRGRPKMKFCSQLSHLYRPRTRPKRWCNNR